jgi:hypothetical protein
VVIHFADAEFFIWHTVAWRKNPALWPDDLSLARKRRVQKTRRFRAGFNRFAPLKSEMGGSELPEIKAVVFYRLPALIAPSRERCEIRYCSISAFRDATSRQKESLSGFLLAAGLAALFLGRRGFGFRFPLRGLALCRLALRRTLRRRLLGSFSLSLAFDRHGLSSE